MKNKKSVVSMFFAFYFIFVAGCNLYSFGVDEPPYGITGKIVCEENNPAYETAGFVCKFNNYSDKTVKNMYVCFALYDDEGVPLKQINVRLQSDVAPQKKAEFCISLDGIVPETINENYSSDFVYASKIIYDDNSEWDDPMGLRYLF